MKPRVFRRRLAVEATLALAGAVLLVKVFPAVRVTAWAARPPRQIRRFADPEWPQMIADAVNRAAARLRPKAPCLPSALSAQFMLRRRGIASRLCLGVRRVDDGLSAHAWVEVNGKVIMGETDDIYTQLGAYGPGDNGRLPA